MWNVKFLSEAEADMHSLDNSLKKQILKGIALSLIHISEPTRL